jgi:ABC-type glutathione transport system ATPase component
LQVARGEVFALVGESGSGKSTIARAVSGLIGVQQGEMRFAGEKLRPIGQRPLALKKRIQFVFQNPDASLNPRRSVGDSLARPLAVFNGLRGTEARRRIAGALEDVQLPPSYAGKFPDELSGGERQRIAIARALLAEPDLILCDEVLSALDVSVQANILELLKRLRRETGIAMLFITHDLAVVEQIADNVGVLYRGELLEWGSVGEVFSPPYHPYTRSLLEAVPGRNGDAPFVQ